MALEELGKWIQGPNNNSESHQVLPLSLLSFKSATKALALKRDALQNLEKVVNYLRTLGFDCISQQNNEWTTHLGSQRMSSGLAESLSKVFHKHVKPKKQHELYRLSQCCATVTKATKCQTVVDIGAGVGHLSRFLTYGYGLNLICLECQDKLGAAAVKLDAQLEEACKKLTISDFTTPRHVTMTLSPSTNNLKELIDGHTVESSPVGLIGLHTCGDLGPTLIRNFAKQSDIRFILAIGCCYMKMNCDR